MKKIILTTLLSVLFVGTIYAQSEGRAKQYYSFGWSISEQIGSSNDFISNVSPAGFTFSGQVYLTSQFAIGFNVSWNNYHQFFDRESYKIDDGLYATASQYRYAKVIPFQVGGYYNFMPDNMIQPYAGLNVGFAYSQQNIFISDYDFWDDDYGFRVSPEIGAFIYFGQNSNWGANIAVNYAYNTNSYTFLKEYKGIQAITGTIGLFWAIK